MAVFHRRRVVFHEMYLLPEPIFGTKKHRSESFGSYIWLQVSIKVVTLFIHVNRHPVASHMNNTRTHTLATRTKTFLMQSERKQKCCWCGMKNVWMKWILMCVCVKHTTVLVLQKKRLSECEMYTFESTMSKTVIHIEMYVVYVNHTLPNIEN